ncbi:MAG: glycosyltransferase [Oscillospiraceae bacterium]
MEQPIVSVIIPVYNCEKYLRQCLDSVKNQTLKDIEIICVDDGSTDSSGKILEEYAKADSRFICLKQKNAGAGAARNNGLKIAKGKYLSFLDSDDFFEETMLEKAVEKIAADKADFVVFRCNQYLNDTQTYRSADYTMRLNTLPPYTPFNFRAITGNVFKTFVGWAWDKLYDREFVLKNNLTFQEQRTSNDMRFVFTALVLAKKITYITDVLAHQRRNNGSSLSNTREKSWFCFYNALKELRDNLKNAGLYKELERDYINYALHFSLWNINTITGDCYYKLYDKLHNEWFEDLGIKGKPADYFYDLNEYKQGADIIKYSAKEYTTKISAAVISDNCGDSLKNCLDSILNSKDISLEVICIDNCSDDGSADIIKGYAEKYPNVTAVLSKTKLSEAQILDMGIDSANGQYIHFLDGKDTVEPTAYSKLYKLAHKNDIDCLKAAANAIDISTGKKINNPLYSLEETDRMLNESLVSFHGFPKKMFKISSEAWNGLYKRQFLQQNNIRFSNWEHSSELAFYVTVCMKAEKFMISRTKLVNHKVNCNSSVNAEKHFDELTYNYELLKGLSKELDLDEITERKLLEQQLSDIAVWSKNELKNGNSDSKLENSIQAFFKGKEKLISDSEGIL